MRVPILVPDVRPGDESLVISGWLVDEGDLILAGDLLVELLLPGITFDVTSDATGRLVEIVKPIDSVISVGDVLGWVEETRSDEDEDPSQDEPD